MTNDFTTHLTTRLEHVLTVAKEELAGIRTGRATPALLEGLKCEVYGASMTLRELASITTDGATNLLVAPFDISIIKEIEKAIASSPLGVSSRLEGKTLRVMIPPLSSEQREKMSKLASSKIEEAKEMTRRDRDDERKKVKSSFDAKEMGEDDKFRIEKEIDDLIKKYAIKLDEMKSAKITEISSV